VNGPVRPPADEAWLEQKLAFALERLGNGEQVDARELARERPELAAELDAALSLRSLLGGAAAPAAGGELLAGRYRLLAELGRGAAGVVHRAFDEHLQREVAIKLLHPGSLTGAAVERFRREALALARMTHANIVRVHDHGTAADGRQFLVMELLAGHSLQAILDAARTAMGDTASAAAFRSAPWLHELLPAAALYSSFLRQCVHWTVQLGAGLAAAHAAGIWHRDVKPRNAFVRSDGTAMLLDFGIAAREGDAALTLEHSIVGTPCYMAPEQAAGRVEPGPALDVYGLAATLYHLLTLRAPFHGDLAEVLRALRDDDPAPARDLHNGLPVDLQAVLDKGLARRPQDRYRAIADLVADLQAFLEHRPVSVRPLGGLQRAWRRIRRRPLRTVSAVTGIVAVGALALALPALSALSTVATATEAKELRAHLPADLAIEGWPDERLLVPLTEQQKLLAELDRLLELDADDAAVRVLRASLRLDAGDHGGAAVDLALLRRHYDSPYLRAVAERFAAADRAKAGIAAVDFAGLPAPQLPADCFVAGFLALRARDSEAADDLLRRAGEFPPARDLRLLAMLGLQHPDPEAIVAEAGRLEGLYGQPTARTRHALGAAMLMVKHWEEAARYCEQALQLRPDRHGPWNNLGLAHLRLGRLDEAARCYAKAVAFRPWFPNSLSGLAQTLREQSDFDGARASAAKIRDVCWREHELGNIDVAEALAARRAGNAERQRTCSQAAVQHFAGALAATAGTRNPRAKSLPGCVAYARALVTDDTAAQLPFAIDAVRSEPRNAQQLANLVDLLANEDIDGDLRDRLRALLVDIAADLAPEDATIRQMRDRLRRRLQQLDNKTVPR